MPEEVMREELDPPITLNALAGLKARWGVSMQALTMRASDLSIITPRQKKYLFMKLSRAGWRKREPVHVPIERPLGLRRMIEVLFGAPIDTRSVARELSIPEHMLIESLTLQEGYLPAAAAGGKGPSAEIIDIRQHPPI